ncbi:unnamed protein product, partial [Rotaria magnacalcarata]
MEKEQKRRKENHRNVPSISAQQHPEMRTLHLEPTSMCSSKTTLSGYSIQYQSCIRFGMRYDRSVPLRS